jgi:hypothetical protein
VQESSGSRRQDEIKQNQIQRGCCHNSEAGVQCKMPQRDSTNLLERCVLAFSMQKTRCCQYMLNLC